jgi:hypothetical protein
VNIENILSLCVAVIDWAQILIIISLDMEIDDKQSSMVWSRSYQQCLLFQRQPVGKISHWP